MRLRRYFAKSRERDDEHWIIALRALRLAPLICIGILVSCSADVPTAEVGVSSAMRSLASKKVPFDGKLYSESAGRIVINLDTPLCSTKDGPLDFTLESSDFLEPLAQPVMVGGGDRQIAETDDRCRREDAVHFRGSWERQPYEKGQKIFVYVRQRGAFWAGWVRRPAGDFGDFTNWRWLSREERLRRSFRNDSKQIGQAFGIFVATN